MKSFSKVFFIVYSLAFLLSGCDELHLKSSGGVDYVVKEKSIDQERIRPTITAIYDEASDSIIVTAWFELLGSSIREMPELQDVKIENELSITIDGNQMKFQTFESYLGDDSLSDIVGCEYNYKIEGLNDPSKVFVFKWTSQSGRTYTNNIQIPTALHLTNFPKSISSSSNSISVSYDGTMVASSEKVLIAMSVAGTSNTLNFDFGSQNLLITSANLNLGSSSSLDLNLIHQSQNQANEMPPAGGSIVGEYHAVTTTIKINPQ